MYAILLCLPAFFKEKPLLLVFAAMSEEFLSLLELNRLFKQNSFFPLLQAFQYSKEEIGIFSYYYKSYTSKQALKYGIS